MKHQRPPLRESALHWIPVSIALGAILALVVQAHGVEDPDGLEVGATLLTDGQAWERERQEEERRRALVEIAEKGSQQ